MTIELAPYQRRVFDRARGAIDSMEARAAGGGVMPTSEEAEAILIAIALREELDPDGQGLAELRGAS